MRTPAPVLSVAGSDPSGGAGIQADLKAFLDHRTYGMAVITALTAQNTTGVSGIHAVPVDFVAEQIRMVLADIPPRAVKIGMLGTAALVAGVADALADYDGPVVLDPVMVATSGARLLDDDAEQALLERLVPRATVLTPNIPEAAVLLGDESPRAFARRTGIALLCKDGHADGPVVRDVLHLPDGSTVPHDHPRIDTADTHGTGCTLSSAIAARLARGEPLPGAVHGAIAYVADLIDASAGSGLGAGRGPLLHGSRGPR